jgi:sulfate permease, SulP family
MFLISTVICQVTMTLTSSFPMAFGMMMVENIPFMHIICNIAIDAQGMGKDTFATVFVAFAISTISVGVFFYLLGHYQLGNVVYFFPKHVIVGCIGGIGVFLFTTGMEGSTNTTWKWDFDVITAFFSPALLPLWLTSLFFEFVLRGLSLKIKNPLLAPFFFVSIPFIFYAILVITRTPIATAHQMGWFFQGVSGKVDPLLIWELIDFRLVNWMSILKSMPTIIALTIFSLMHVPINIPSLSISTGHPTDMNKELKAHGISNILSGCFGGLQNYVCYCNSVTYFKCNGGGIVSGLLLALSSSIFFFIGPSAVFFVPRCMAGCLLMHIGSDLTKEALWDSIGTFDIFEYGSVVAITIVMTAYGMTAGLALGVFCAALTFTLQTSRNVQPIRAIRSARTLRSCKWRSQQMNNVLDQHSKHISVIQLQGHLFFGNASLLSAKVESILQKAHAFKEIKFIVLDFTLVLAIDSSAAETIAKIYEVCAKYEVRLCYSRASPKGFPCVSKLTERIRVIASKDQLDAELKQSKQEAESKSSSAKKRSKSDKKKSAREMQPITKTFNVEGIQPLKDKEFIVENTNPSHKGDIEAPASRNQTVEGAVDDTVFVANSLDEGLAWCEDVIIREHLPHCDMDNLSKEEFLVEGKPLPVYLRRLHMLCPCESVEVVNSLFEKFEIVRVSRNTVLWRQGDISDRAVMLCRGKLLSTLEEEGERLVTEDISVGHLVS